MTAVSHYHSDSDLEMTLSYNEEKHALAISADDITEVLATTNVQEKLQELGIYTRVDELERRTTNEVLVKLRPAAGVDIRGKNEDGKSVLLERLISPPDSVESVLKRRGAYSYVASIDESALDASPLDPEGSVTVSVQEMCGGEVGVFLSQPSGGEIRTIRGRSSPSITLPPAVASSIDLDGHIVEWNATEGGLSGHTSASLKRIKPPSGDVSTTISRVSQSVGNGSKTKQEHTVAYIRQEHSRALGWEEGDCIDIRLVWMDGGPGVIVTTDVRPKFIEVQPDGVVKPQAPCTRTLYEGTPSQLYFNFPTDMAKTFSLAGKRIRWESQPQEGRLVGKFPS